jgi:hypothetical protein
METLAVMQGRSTAGNATCEAFLLTISNTPGDEKTWFLDELSLNNVPVKRRCFPKESVVILRESLDAILSLALSLESAPP